MPCGVRVSGDHDARAATERQVLGDDRLVSVSRGLASPSRASIAANAASGRR